jgi:hypothetical protein
MVVRVAPPPSKDEQVALQASIAAAAKELAAAGQARAPLLCSPLLPSRSHAHVPSDRPQAAVEARCTAAMMAMVEEDGKVAVETLLATQKYQLAATGEFSCNERMLLDMSKHLFVKTDCGDPLKLAKLTTSNLSNLPGNKGIEHLIALEKSLGLL